MAHSIAPNPVKYQLASEDPEMHQKLAERYDVAPNGCHEWNRGISSRGYGITHHNRKTLSAHRLAYWIRYGAIPNHLVVDHMCQNRKCINTDHLRPLTAAENMSIAHSAHKSECKHGHPLTDETVYVFHDRKGNPHRQCRACRPAIDARSKARRAGIGNDELRQAALSATR